jgi:hypothetical protein
MAIVVGFIAGFLIKEHDGKPGPGWGYMFNEEYYYITVGYSFFIYDKTGCLLPIMEASNEKQNFHWLLISGMAILVTIQIAFVSTVYYAYGDDITEPIIIL